jgi:ribonuclease HII
MKRDPDPHPLASLYLAGVDEAGRGPLAGPVTAAAVVLPPGYKNSRITDSKQLSAATRDALYEEILHAALAYSCVSVGPRRIERFNIREATRLAMTLAANRVTKALGSAPHLLIDGNMLLRSNHTEEAIIKGDGLLLPIGAASIVAKVTRDRLMELLEQRYPGYQLGKHKGYGTETHRQQIQLRGPCAAHRRTFAGVREYCSEPPLSPPRAVAVESVGGILPGEAR